MKLVDEMFDVVIGHMSTPKYKPRQPMSSIGRCRQFSFPRTYSRNLSMINGN